MKNLFLALVATILFSGFAFGQIVIDPGNSTFLEVPDEFKSNQKNASTFTSITKYVPEINGHVLINFDNNNKVVSIVAPKNPKLFPNSLVNYFSSKNTNHGCWDKPSELGVIGCAVEGIIAGIISIFK